MVVGKPTTGMAKWLLLLLLNRRKDASGTQNNFCLSQACCEDDDDDDDVSLSACLSHLISDTCYCNLHVIVPCGDPLNFMGQQRTPRLTPLTQAHYYLLGQKGVAKGFLLGQRFSEQQGLPELLCRD